MLLAASFACLPAALRAPSDEPRRDSSIAPLADPAGFGEPEFLIEAATARLFKNRQISYLFIWGHFLRNP